MSNRFNRVELTCGDKVYEVRLNTRDFRNGSTHIVIGIQCDTGVNERVEGLLGLSFSAIPDIQTELVKRTNSQP